MKKKNRILVLGLTFSMLISSGSLTGCDSAAGNMGKETTGVEYEEADYELSEESCSDSGIDAADPGTVDNETEKTAENRTDAEKSTETEESQTDNSTDSGLWKKASTTPYGKYPELVTYTLGQMSGANNSNLPAGNTYEDSAYTRYLKEILNVQNENAYMEREDRYDEYVNVLVNDHTLPDVLVVSDRETLNVLVENDMVEDLTEVYANCTSPRIKDKDGEIVYGSLTEETRSAVAYLRELYERGILDQNFALRAQNNLRDLVVEGKCGAFFGLWWAPNNPLMDVAENDPEADWEPYYLTAEYQEKDNVYASFRDNKYVVVRKGYEHPEIVMKIISVLFDYSRFEDEENADEINSYFALNVDPTARPLVINVDYNEAIYNVTKDIRRVMSGKQKASNLSALEKSYYDACMKYLSGKNVTVEDWAAYKSRISAVGVLVDGHYSSVRRTYLVDSDGEIPNMLASLEKNAFIQMIMGEQPMDYFDTFVEEWYNQGGRELTEKIREENS